MHAKKTLGQHFLRCRWVADTMVKAAGLTKRDYAIEIGPGAGALTLPLARAAGSVVAIEKDEALAGVLRAELARKGIGNVTVIAGDILETPKSLIPKFPQSKIIASIPYYLTSRFFRYLLESPPRPKSIVVLIQKEVADRIVAQPPHMNLLALSVKAFGRPEKIKTVPRECFSPKPDVTSCIIRIADISDAFFRKNNIEPEEFFKIVRVAFGKKRKMLSSSLKNIVPANTFERVGINKNARPQELDRDLWARLLRKKNSSGEPLAQT